MGGNVAGAELMACYARESCGYAGELTIEADSRSTWENLQNAIPMIEDADRIKIVSNSLHAEKARFYLWQHRPDLAERLVPAMDYQFGELILIKPVMAVIGLRHIRNAVRSGIAAAGTAGVTSGTGCPGPGFGERPHSGHEKSPRVL